MIFGINGKNLWQNCEMFLLFYVFFQLPYRFSQKRLSAVSASRCSTWRHAKCDSEVTCMDDTSTRSLALTQDCDRVEVLTPDTPTSTTSFTSGSETATRTTCTTLTFRKILPSTLSKKNTCSHKSKRFI